MNYRTRYQKKHFFLLGMLLIFVLPGVATTARTPALPAPMSVTGMSPATGMPGTLITIRGESFGATQGAKLVAMNYNRVNLMEVRRWSNTEIQAVVPNLPVGEYSVVVYYDNTYRTYAPWSSSSRFRIIPREIPLPPPPTPGIPTPRSPAITCSPISSTNMVLNPDFNEVSTRGAFTTTTGTGGAGLSAAANWLKFINGSGTIQTKLVPITKLPTTRPGASGNMIWVKVNQNQSGILQNFLGTGPTPSPNRVAFSAWVYVVSGKMLVGVGNGGATPAAAYSTTTGRWELIKGCNRGSPANTILFYSDNDTGAEFYVDFAEVKNADPSYP